MFLGKELGLEVREMIIFHYKIYYAIWIVLPCSWVIFSIKQSRLKTTVAWAATASKLWHIISVRIGQSIKVAEPHSFSMIPFT